MIIQTGDLQSTHQHPHHINHQIYNGLDCCLTMEVHEEISRQLPGGAPPAIYSFERALQAPYLEIMQRGFRVNQSGRAHAAEGLRAKREKLQSLLDEFAFAIWDKPLNPRSPSQLKDFFFRALALPEVWLSSKGERKLSTSREALEKIEVYLHARPFVSIILAIRDIGKQLDVFETEIDPDGRFRTSYNIAGTETGRPSSSSNAYGTGGNAQNIAPGLRYIFESDPGFKLCVIDLEQVEARDVGYFCGCLFGDWTFLDNCESGDLHTNNAKLIWPDLPWTCAHRTDRKIADRTFYREFSYRDFAKRGGHLCLTEDHEVLTPTGWVPISEKPIQIMSWADGRSEFSIVSHWTDELYTGTLNEFYGNSVSAVMTDEHRVPYCLDNTAGKIRVRTAKEGPGKFMPLGDDYVGGDEEVPARLIAAFMSDGSQKSTNRMEFHLSKERKILRLKQLCELSGYVLEARAGNRYLVHGSLPKRAGAFMFNWTKKCLREFLDEYKHWDGHISPTAVALFSIDREHMEWIQTFGRILGIGGTLSHSRTKTSFSGSEKIYETDYYRLQQNHRQWASGKSMHWGKEKVAKVRVLCPTVPSGFFYIRRNGKISVTGNSNYYGTAWTAARSLKVPASVTEEFQARYIRGRYGHKTLPDVQPAFPSIAKWWQWTGTQLQSTGLLTTPFGRRRHFFGRPGDDTTLREAIAFLPQSTTADRMNLGLWRTWHREPKAQLLAQTYDSISFQAEDNAQFDSLVERVLDHIRVELRAPSGRTYIVPGEAKVGWNWGYADPSKGINPEGLMKWKPGTDKRVRRTGLSRLAF